MTSDQLTPDQWLYATLAGDSTLTSGASGSRIYDDSVPQTATFPFVQIRYLLTTEDQTINATRYMLATDYLIVAVDRADLASGIVDQTVLETIAARVETLLHQASGNVSRGHVYFCARQRPYRARTVMDGIEVRELGDLYRVWSQAA